MPLIEIHGLPPAAGVDPAGVTREVNLAVSQALHCRLDAVWTVWHTISGAYSKGGATVLGEPSATHGPIVHVYLKRSPTEAKLVADAITDALSRELKVAPDSIFVTLQPVEIDS